MFCPRSGAEHVDPFVLAWVRARLCLGSVHLGPHGPRQGLDGNAYLAVPVPPAPAPLPQQIRLGARMDQAADVQVSILVNGAYTDLGGFGTPSGDEDEHGWSKRALDLGAALRSAAGDGAGA